MLIVDGLHALNEGVYKDYCIGALWIMIDRDVFNTGLPMQDRQAETVARIKPELSAWYKSKHVREPLDRLYEVSNLTSLMVGSSTSRSSRSSSSAVVDGMDQLCHHPGNRGQDWDRTCPMA